MHKQHTYNHMLILTSCIQTIKIHLQQCNTHEFLTMEEVVELIKSGKIGESF